MQEYNKNLKDARQNKRNGKLSLCVEGYACAKTKYAVYPSAYANGFASKLCNKLGKRPSSKSENKLKTWFKEKWVNVCANLRSHLNAFATEIIM